MDGRQEKRHSSEVTAARERRSKRTILKRTVILMLLCGVGLFIPLFLRLWDIAIVHHEDYQRQATGQQTLDLSVSAARGNIYDCNGNVLAMSATVYNCCLLYTSQFAKGCTCPPDFPVCVCGKTPDIKLVNKKPILPTQQEIDENPRARSAKLRVAEKIK